MYTPMGWLIIQVVCPLMKFVIYIERYDIVLLDRVQGGSYAFSNHGQMDVALNTGYA